MPELPEVEIVRQSLEKKVRDKIIQKVLIKNRNLRFKIQSNFQKHLLKKKIKKIDRFSKYIIITFDDSSGFIIHLGMSGTIHLLHINKKNIYTNSSFYNSPILPKKHNHIEIEFEKIKIIYNDPRRFGYFLTFNNKLELNKKFLHFGIGNIYANEILFNSKINPSRKAKNLNKSDCKKILFNSKLVLKMAIKKGGSTIQNFKNVNGKIGSFQKNFKVYQRENLKCIEPKCSGFIKKKIISNRSSFFCNYCQK